jgi:hypothetical protein
MARKDKVKETASGVPPKKPSMVQSLGAAIAGIIAVKLAGYVITTGWRLATRENPPQADEAVSIGKKALWIGLVGAATGAARQAARDFIQPPGPA